jgi:hypothetical protein
MKPYSNDQNGHNRPRERFIHARRWQDIPLEDLREFAEWLLNRYTLRGLAKMLGTVKPTAVSDFVNGRTKPERRTMEAFGELFFEFHPLGYLAKEIVPKRLVVSQLKEALPEDSEEAALEFVENLIAAGEEKGLFKRPSGPLREWLMTVLSAEYSTDHRYEQYERKRSPKRKPKEKNPEATRGKNDE